MNGKKRLALCAALALTLVLCCSFFVACDDETETRAIDKDDVTYRVFFDDFNAELDSKFWNVHHEPRKGGYWDNEQAYTKDGNLVLRTVEKNGEYFAGAVDSLGKFETHFGYFEARCHLPKASGIWAAFWLMPQGMMYGNPTTDVSVCGAEIDIMESPYYNPYTSALFENLMPRDMDTYQCAVHVGDYGDNYIKKEIFVNTKYTQANIAENAPQVSIYDGWHTFGLDWTEEYYRFYLDRRLVCEITDKDLLSTVQDDFLFLSVEVLGENSVAKKTPNGFFFANDVSENPEGTFPIDFLVDYVAVYTQRPF